MIIELLTGYQLTSGCFLLLRKTFKILPMSLKFVAKVSAITPQIHFPQKLKGTIVERWANFWKNLFIDYVQMVKDLRTDMQDNPKKAFYYIGGLSTALALARSNPTEVDFKDDLRKYTNELILVGDECRNSDSTEHLKNLQRCYNEGILKRLSLGVASVMYTTEYNDKCALYKAHCKYTSPTYLSFPSRIVDVGVMGKWWNIFIKTCNYDVNPREVINHAN